MADREPFPYVDDWRKDVPALMNMGVMSAVAKGIITLHPSHAGRVAEVLHCRAVWSEWSFSNNGERFLNIQYRYPSILFGENEIGQFPVDEDPLRAIGQDHYEALAELADTRTTEIWRPTDNGLFIPAVAA